MQKCSAGEFAEAMRLLIADKKTVAELKSYYQGIFTRDMDSFINFNQSMK
jgi:hypothetical protein